MADKIKIRRGEFNVLPNLDEGELGLVTDRGTVYIGTDTDDNILLNPVQVNADGYTLDGYLYPAIDNVHGLGTPDKRWQSVSVGPGSIHITAKDTDPGYTTNSDFKIGIDSSSGNLKIASNTTTIMELGPTGAVSFSDLPKTSSIYYGDGSDGDVTVANGELLVLNRAMYYNSLTIEAGGILEPTGWHIFAKEFIDNSGTIRCDGYTGGNASGSTGGAGSFNTIGSSFFSASIPGLSQTTAGTSGNNGASAVSDQILIDPTFAGKGGNAGVGGNGSTGLIGGSNFMRISAGHKWRQPYFMWNTGAANTQNMFCGAPGSFGRPGGGAASTNTGGGGGCSGSGGGPIFLGTKQYIGQTGSFITANGGNGGNGGNGQTAGAGEGGGGGAGAGGGGGGYVFFITEDFTNDGTIQVNGGSGGSGGLKGDPDAQDGTSGSTGGTGVKQIFNPATGEYTIL